MKRVDEAYFEGDVWQLVRFMFPWALVRRPGSDAEPLEHEFTTAVEEKAALCPTADQVGREYPPRIGGITDPAG